jgi:phenylalanyl-tRNA synthetase alpha subunit
MNNNDEIESIIQELKADEKPVHKPVQPTEIEHLNDNNVGEYVYTKSAALIESTLNAINALQENVVSGSDAKEIAALSQLINSATKALDQLNKLNMQNKQKAIDMELKKMEIDANANKPMLPNTTNVLIATRDEIMKQIFDKPAKKSAGEIVDIDFKKD